MASGYTGGQHRTLTPSLPERKQRQGQRCEVPRSQSQRKNQSPVLLHPLPPAMPQTVADSENVSPVDVVSSRLSQIDINKEQAGAVAPEPPRSLAPCSGSLAVLGSACHSLRVALAPWTQGGQSRAGVRRPRLSSPFPDQRAPPLPQLSPEGPDPGGGRSRLRCSCTRSTCSLPRPAHAEVSRWRIKLIPILYPGAGTQISTHPGRVGTELQVRLSGVQALGRRGRQESSLAPFSGHLCPTKSSAMHFAAADAGKSCSRHLEA